MERKEDLVRVTLRAEERKEGKPREETVGEVVPGEVRRHESPEGAVLEELAEGDGVSLGAGGLLGLARLLLLVGLAGIGGLVIHVADRPPGTPDETEDAEEVEDSGPAAEEEDDGGANDEAGERSHVEATEGGGHSLGALGAGDALGENASGRGGRDTLAETDEEAGRRGAR